MHSHLITLGKTPVVWEEAVLNFPETARQLKKGTIVEAWTTSANVEKILQSNADTYLIHAPSDFFYLDCGMGSFLGNWPGGSSWCTYVTWQKQVRVGGVRRMPSNAYQACCLSPHTPSLFLPHCCL